METRSAEVRSRCTVLKRDMARALRRQGVTGWRRKRRVAGAELDLAWPRERVALRLNDCFCHGHVHGRARVRGAFWASNLARNMAQANAMRSEGWLVVTLWECWLRGLGADALARMVSACVEPRRR